MAVHDYEKQVIQVRRKRAAGQENDSYELVEAHCVAGEDGILAAWVDGNTLYIASGDDGSWWEIYACHTSWGTRIVNVLGYALQK